MKVLKSIYRFFKRVNDLRRSYFWCLFHGVEYKKGIYIGHHVKKDRSIKLFLSEQSRLSDNVMLWGSGPIKIGFSSSIGSWSRLYACDGFGIEIGNYVNAASHLYIIDSNHGIKKGELIMSQPFSSKKVVIGNDVWFGYHVTVLPGVCLGNGVVCGACSVVTKSFPENAVICGVPATIIKYRE